MRGTTGLMFIVIGVSYALFAVSQAMYGRLLLGLSPAFPADLQGVVHSVLVADPFTASLLLGASLAVFGHVLAWIERGLGHRVPSFIGWELLALSAIALALRPSLGLGLAVVVAIYTIVVARRSGRAPANPTPGDRTAALRGTIGLLLAGIGTLHIVFGIAQAVAQASFWMWFDDSSMAMESVRRRAPS